MKVSDVVAVQVSNNDPPLLVGTVFMASCTCFKFCLLVQHGLLLNLAIIIRALMRIPLSNKPQLFKACGLEHSAGVTAMGDLWLAQLTSL